MLCCLVCSNIRVSKVNTMDKMLVSRYVILRRQAGRDVNSCSSGSRVRSGVQVSSGERGVDGIYVEKGCHAFWPL
jgi:hypothetical protein